MKKFLKILLITCIAASCEKTIEEPEPVGSALYKSETHADWYLVSVDLETNIHTVHFKLSEKGTLASFYPKEYMFYATDSSQTICSMNVYATIFKDKTVEIKVP